MIRVRDTRGRGASGPAPPSGGRRIAECQFDTAVTPRCRWVCLLLCVAAVVLPGHTRERGIAMCGLGVGSDQGVSVDANV